MAVFRRKLSNPGDQYPPIDLNFPHTQHCRAMRIVVKAHPFWTLRQGPFDHMIILAQATTLREVGQAPSC
ncbi:MAG: hypothetical protein IPP59_19300 [Betaproteobacteria bacterium]|nr:hypothetical protein [Candidatus Dechloromonas phosphorivorans]